MQEGRALASKTCQLKGKILLKPIYEKEMLAILHAINKWFPYLIGRHLKATTYHDTMGTNMHGISTKCNFVSLCMK